MKNRKTRNKKEDFSFEFEGKLYRIKQPYSGEPATFVLSTGKILHVRVWRLGFPMQPEKPDIETFDPECTPATDVAIQVGGFFAEFVEA